MLLGSHTGFHVLFDAGASEEYVSGSPRSGTSASSLSKSQSGSFKSTTIQPAPAPEVEVNSWIHQSALTRQSDHDLQCRLGCLRNQQVQRWQVGLVESLLRLGNASHSSRRVATELNCVAAGTILQPRNRRKRKGNRVKKGDPRVHR